MAERASGGRKLVVLRQFDSKSHTMHVKGNEIPASFPDLHKELALNHKLKTTLGLHAWEFSCLTSKTRRNSPPLHWIEQAQDMHPIVEHC
jgi:hypothetical protein